LHFVYEWSGESLFVGIFSPINESVWEHLKLLFFPMSVWILIGYFIFGKKFKTYIPSAVIGILSGMILIPMWFYTYTVFTGKPILFLDILSFIISVCVAFFITAHYLNTQSELVQRMIDEGHIVGNHTVNHKSMPDLDDEKIKSEIMELHKSVYEKFGYEMKYIRPPMGEYSERTLEITKSLGYTTTMWSFAYDDWNEQKQGREEYGKTKVISNVHNGAIILLHANSVDNSNILDSCIKEIKNMGYEFKSLDEFKL